MREMGKEYASIVLRSWVFMPYAVASYIQPRTVILYEATEAHEVMITQPHGHIKTLAAALSAR